jgi:hypothetical protein
LGAIFKIKSFNRILGETMLEIKTLVISSCTGEKKYKLENQITQDDFRDRVRLATREEELKSFRLPAGKMYTGQQHLRLIEGIELLRVAYGREVMDLSIVSAGYGLVHEEKEIVPYEVSFNNMKAGEIKDWAKLLKINQSVSQMIKDYDLVFFLLGDKYLQALELPLDTNNNQKIIFLASKTSRKLIPNKHPYYFIEVGKAEARSFSYGLVGLKGYLFKLLAQEIVKQGMEIIESIDKDPYLFINLIDVYREKTVHAEQLRVFPETVTKVSKDPKSIKKKNVFFCVPDKEVAKNYGIPVNYYIPEWDDRVDPDYNFLTDESIKGRDPHTHDFYAHEIYEVPNYDGILVSKITIEQNKKKKAKMSSLGVHDFLRFNKEKPIMGDCGAFGYIDEYEPPYQTHEIIDYFEHLGFNYGVSIDHLIVGEYASDPVERQRRFKITRDNAEDFISKWKTGKYSFMPIGVAQGWDPFSYREAVANLVQMGYQYIALGGLVRTPSRQIFEIMKIIRPIIPEYLKVHLFGVARIEPLETFHRLGMTSFDSASYLRNAWLSSAGKNYFTLDGESFSAIRIPPVDGHGVRIKKMIEQGKRNKDQFRELEKAALVSLRNFDRGLTGIDEALENVLAYDELIGDDREQHAEMYRHVLEEQPWKKCDCMICQEIGIEVIIFRGNNRNRRRGFHNTYVFYNQFKNICK